LFQHEDPKSVAFEGLPTGIVPVFPIERSIKVKNFSVRRTQVPMCPAFCLTDYKVQSLTLNTAVLDLKKNPTAKGRQNQFFSNNVELSRIRNKDKLHILEKIDMSDLAFHPPDNLTAEMERLDQLQKETISSWAEKGFVASHE
jgi:hypothetical protein